MPTASVSQFVGRQRELEALRTTIGAAIEFQAPQLITVVGNQGTGKTRLVQELLASIEQPGLRAFWGRGAPDGERLGIIRSLLNDRFRLTPGQSCTPDVLDGFRKEVAATFDDARVDEVTHVLGEFVGLKYPDSPFLRVLSENPGQYDDVSRTVLRRFIELDAQRSPLVLVFDGLQWADDETVGLVRKLGSRLGGSSVALIVCARPELLVRWGDWGADVTDHLRVDVRNLEPDDAEVLFRDLLGPCDGVTDELIDDALQMTEGNPSFLVQLVELYEANGTLTQSAGRRRLDSARAAQTSLPVSVEEAIEARIAALAGMERQLLERGAVFGNVFWMGALVAMGRIDSYIATTREPGQPPPPPPVSSNLDYRWNNEDEPMRERIAEVVNDLVERDYLLRLELEDSTIQGDVELVFKHNLERELIVSSIPANRQKRYHRLAAQWLEAHLLGRTEEQLEFLAQLHEQGGDRGRAADCYLAAADKARSRYANRVAVRLYGRALDLIEPEDATAGLRALHNLGDVLALVGETDEATERFSDMLRLAWIFDSPAKAGAAHGRLARVFRQRGDYDIAMNHLREANSLFGEVGDQRGVAATLDDIGRIHWLRGGYGQALEFHRQALSIRKALADRRSIGLSLANIGRVHRDSGAFKAAVAQFREALDLRRDIGDLSGVIHSLCDLGGVYTEDDNCELALSLLAEAMRIADNIGDKSARIEVLRRTGECHLVMGRERDAIAEFESAQALATELGDRVALASCAQRLAEASLHVGDVPGADEHSQRALAISEAVGSRVHVATAHRARAETIAMADKTEEGQQRALAHYRKAVDVLVSMNNELELARTYRSFAGFHERAGNAADANKLRQRAEDILARLRGAASVD